MSNPPVSREVRARPWGAEESLLRRVIAGGGRLLRRERRDAPAAADPAAPQAPPAEAETAPVPPPDRSLWSNRLWGEGMALPGGTEEVLRLAALLPLGPEHTLLVAGLGARAAGGVVAGGRGCFVAAHDLAPPAGPATGRGAVKRVTALTLAPEAPAFRAAYHHHALLLEPLRHGGSPDALMHAVAAGLREGGELVLLELVSRDGAADAAWLRAEERQPPPAATALPAALERAGFRIHVAEDAGPRHQRAALLGWSALLKAVRAERTRLTASEAAALVAEAEAWLLRLRLLRDGRLRLLRWHATKQRRA